MKVAIITGGSRGLGKAMATPVGRNTELGGPPPAQNKGEMHHEDNR